MIRRTSWNDEEISKLLYKGLLKSGSKKETSCNEENLVRYF